MKRLLAPAIGPRPVVRVVQPAGALTDHLDRVEAGLARLEAAGCAVRWDRRRATDNDRGYLCGDDAIRTRDLVDALSEPDVEIVWFARGGSGTARVAESVVDAAAERGPRIVVGFSDATSLLNALAARLGWVTFLGPVLASLTSPGLETNIEAALACFRGEPLAVDFDPFDCPPIEGRLMGGNLTVLASTAGTTLWPWVQGGLWLLEDVGEAPYRLDRLFWQLRAAGLTRSAAGLWLGDFGLAPHDHSLAVEIFACDADVPIATGAPAGHRGRLATLPIGARVLLDPRLGRLRSLEPVVS